MDHYPSFQSLMVNAVCDNFDVTGKTVLELASDPEMLAASSFVKNGADRVIASDLDERWKCLPPVGVETSKIDARSIPLDDQSVDVVFGINFLEHLTDISATIRSIARVLRSDGFCLLHGHPLWTSARGHHVMSGENGSEMHFEHNNPLPLWGHLYMGPDEILSAGEVVGHWCLDSDEISRRPRRAIIGDLYGGVLRLEALWEDRAEHPSADVVSKLQDGPWWDADEDYSVRGITAILRRA